MKLVQVQIAPWDKPIFFHPKGSELVEGDKVIVETQSGINIGSVLKLVDVDNNKVRLEKNIKNIKQDNDDKFVVRPILRKATSSDLDKLANKDEKKEALSISRKLAQKNNLSMKIVDAFFSFDRKQLTFVFVANDRVDFRNLVKDLSNYFKKNIRLQQIGVRDEARIYGDYGPCGLPLCCKTFLKKLKPVNLEMAQLQQMAHRGNEKITGVCGRLKCCLAYEQKDYEEMSKDFPPLESWVKFKNKKGKVINWHILRRTVDVKFLPEKRESRGTILELDIDKIKR